MRVLITGARGFVGRHLTERLRRDGDMPLCLDLPSAAATVSDCRACDLTDAQTLTNLVAELQPDACVHLGGIAYVPMGWTDPHTVFTVNVGGTLNLLEAFRQSAPQARILIVSSAELYGRVAAEKPMTEEAALVPDNLYAVSKMSADLSGLLYARRYGMPVMSARPVNHIGPGQSPQFVSSAFANQLSAIAAGKSAPVIKVGNLETSRDFLDVRDVVDAYIGIVRHGRSGEAYNVASGKLISIQSILDLLCATAGVKPTVQIDSALFRPTDHPPLINASKLHRDVGWQPQTPLEKTLTDIYRSIAP